MKRVFASTVATWAILALVLPTTQLWRGLVTGVIIGLLAWVP